MTNLRRHIGVMIYTDSEPTRWHATYTKTIDGEVMRFGDIFDAPSVDIAVVAATAWLAKHKEKGTE